MKPILEILRDTLIATVLLIGGFVLHSALAAPRHLMAVFVVPFLAFLLHRYELNHRPIFWISGLFAALSITAVRYLPPDYQVYSGGFVLLAMAPLLGALWRRKHEGSHDHPAN